MEAKDTTIGYALNSARDDAFMQGRKAGIREVVHWINYYAHNRTISDFLHIPRENWQAQLKEWGITP